MYLINSDKPDDVERTYKEYIFQINPVYDGNL